MLLAGDIGGTKTLVGLFSPGPRRPDLVDVRTFATPVYPSLEAILAEFLAGQGVPALAVRAASFGVAGPIVEQVARLTNVPWHVDAAAVAARFGFPRVTLLNDLQAMAYSVTVLRHDELAVVQAGRPVPTGNAALIAAGTGLGEALLHNVDGRLIPSPTEGGHADFAPRTAEEIALLQFLVSRFGRADYERVISGPGLVNIHRFAHPHGCAVCDVDADSARAPSLISRSALEHRCPDCVRALEIFVSVYGAESGNLALRSVATAGLFLGGGIAPKILPVLQDGRFVEAFCAKAPMGDFMSLVPVAVILNQRAGLLGAAVHANLHAG
ncbi:MAG TPA: glucokinase [Vicinamibacterales bacterium]